MFQEKVVNATKHCKMYSILTNDCYSHTNNHKYREFVTLFWTTWLPLYPCLIAGIFQNTFQNQEQTHRTARARTPDWSWNWQFVFGIEKQRDFSSVLSLFEECVDRFRLWERRPFVVFPSGLYPLVWNLGKQLPSVRCFTCVVDLRV